MAKPVIGISCDVSHVDRLDRVRLNMQYIDAVEQAGGVPLMLATTSKPELVACQLERVDAVVGIGGDDHHPSLYDRDRHYSETLLPTRRQDYDLVFLAEVWQRRLPGLFICASMQGLNIVRGGDLIQHLEDVIDTHQFNKGAGLAHPVLVKPDSLLEQVIGADQIDVNSYHHQAVGQVGSGIVVSGRAPDGTAEVIEPIEFAEHPLLALQWHPERIPEESHSKQLFDWLINEAIKKQPVSVSVVKTNQLSPFF